MLIGLIADTHGLIRPEAIHALEGTDIILHAGDVGGDPVLAALRAIAPVYAVYGNVDVQNSTLTAAVDSVFDGVTVHMSHGHEIGSPTPERLAAKYAADVIVFGHTHRALIESVGSTLVINPGAAGPRRFNVKPSIALLLLPGRDARIVPLG